jgi:hypothetical protein
MAFYNCFVLDGKPDGARVQSEESRMVEFAQGCFPFCLLAQFGTGAEMRGFTLTRSDCRSFYDRCNFY